MRYIVLFFATSTVLGLTSLQATDALVPAAPPASIQQQKPSDELVGLLLSDDRAQQQTDSVLNSTFDAMMARDTGFKEMELEFPGLLDAVKDSLKTVLERFQPTILPAYRADLAALYDQHLTPSEIIETTAFWKSKHGQMVLVELNKNLTFTDTAASIAKTEGNEDISSETIQSDVREAANRTATQLRLTNRDTLAELGRFFSSPTGKKVLALNPQKQKIDIKWFNYLPPEVENELEDSVVNAMVNHIAKTDPKLAKAMQSQMRKDMKREKKAR